MYANIVKPFLDVLSATIGLVFFSPILLLITIVLFFMNKGKPFFFQIRPGIHGRLFKIVKFKTMTDRKDSEGNLLPDSERLVSLGKYIRKTSLDELPQLFNVIKGDMSIIGPRPLLPEYLSLYNALQARRHEVRPGIIGWAQVNGRNAISWKEKLEMDVWYVDNISFKLDVKILFSSVIKVLKQEGINSENASTMERFKGNPDKLVINEE